MPPIKEQLASVIDYLPEPDLSLLLEIANRFLPDDVATPDDLEAIRKSQEEYERGETIPHEAINWD